MWNNTQVKYYQKTVIILESILKDTYSFIKANPDCNEFEVSNFIAQNFKKNNLQSDNYPPIVAFRENTAKVHYYPKKRSALRLKQDSLILIDLWAKLNKTQAPYADLTQMAYYGKNVPDIVKQAFHVVLKSRQKAQNFILKKVNEKNLPIAAEIDTITRGYICQNGLGEKFCHSTGHSLGIDSPHGNDRINAKNSKPIELQTGYTIEPGIYFENCFGIRSEIDFIVLKNYSVLFSSFQNTIIKI